MTKNREGGAEEVPRWLRGTTIAFALFLVFLVGLASSGQASRTLLRIAAQIPGGDKTVHFFLMGTMAFLVNLCWRARSWRLGPLPILKGSALVALIVTLEEASQRYLSIRSFSLEDLAYDYLGIAILGQLAVAIEWWRARRGSTRTDPRQV